MRAVPERVGPYQVLRVLGSGGMGTVYEVRHPKFPRSLALKVIRSQQASKNALARFLREAEYLARIRHPGVVAIHQMGGAPEGPYLVEDLVEGQPLSELELPVPPKRGAEIARDLASALGAVHAAGILHRDLKPGNVVLNQAGSPVLLDFGLARDVNEEQLTRTGDLIGTPAYMSPEQARGLSPSTMGPPVDVYGLGAILFELVAGHRPFEGDAMLEALVRIIHEDPDWPEGDDALPPDLKAILELALAKSPADRYPSMVAFHADLERFLRDEHCEASDRVAELVARRRRARIARGAGLVSLFAGLGLGVWGLWVGLARETPIVPPPPVSAVASDTQTESRPEPFRGLWKLEPGAEFRFRTWFEETESSARISLGVWFVATVGERSENGVHLDVTLEAARVGFGAAMFGGGFEGNYDTRSPNRSPLSSIGEGVGESFSFLLTPETGAVTHMQGVDAIGAKVTDALLRSDGAAIPNFEPTIRTAFTDRFIHKIFESLLHVREDPALSWAEDPDSRQGRTFNALSAAPQPRVIKTLSTGYLHKRDHVFRVTGKALYADGRLRTSTARQKLQGVLTARGNVRDPGTDQRLGLPVASATTWEFHLQRPQDAPLSDYGQD